MPKGEPGLYVSYCAKDFLDGTQMLDPWEELAYRRICDMIYVTNDRLADDDKKLAWATKTGRRWPAIKVTLTGGDKPKLLIVDGRITNVRCQQALTLSAQKMEQRSKAGAASAASGKSLKNLKQRRTNVGSSVPNETPNQPLSTIEVREKTSLREVQKNGLSTEGNPGGAGKGTRLPLDFTMPLDWIDDGAQARVKANLPPVDLATEAVKFANYWAGKSGKDATKTDWYRTWINWCLNARGSANGRDRKSAHDAELAAFELVSR